MTILLPPAALSYTNPAQGWKIDPHRGQVIGAVSRKWQTRPDYQKFLPL